MGGERGHERRDIRYTRWSVVSFPIHYALGVAQSFCTQPCMHTEEVGRGGRGNCGATASSSFLPYAVVIVVAVIVVTVLGLRDRGVGSSVLRVVRVFVQAVTAAHARRGEEAKRRSDHVERVAHETRGGEDEAKDSDHEHSDEDEVQQKEARVPRPGVRV